jgi:large subunit ribosomal protein L15
LAGWSASPIIEGGTSPLIRRIPKRGFHNAWAKIVVAVNVGDLEDSFQAGDEVTLETLRSKNLAKGRFDELKILGDGELTKKLTVSAHRFSQTARAKIEQAGGQTIALPTKKPVVKGVAKRAK